MQLLKTKFCLSLLFFLATGNILAQQKNFDAGVLVNLNIIDISREDHSGIQAPAGNGVSGGISIGAFVKRSLSPSFNLGFELRYIQKGSVYNDDYYSYKNYGTLRLNYIEMPVLIGYKLLPESINITFETGFAAARMFNSDNSIDKMTGLFPNGTNNNFKEWDISWLAALKRSINNVNSLILGFRFERSIVSIHNDWSLYNLSYGLELDYVF